MKKVKSIQKLLAGAAMLALVAGTVPNVYAASPASAGKDPSFSLGSGRTAQVKDVHVLNQSGKEVLAFDVNVHNGSSSSFAFTDYFLELQNTPNIQYNIGLLPEDAGKNYVPAHGDVTFHFYSELTPPAALDKLTLKLMKWDFSSANLADSVGQVKLSEQSVANGTKSGLDWGSGSVNAATGTWDGQDRANSKSVSVQWDMTNDSGKSVTLPDLQFNLISPDGTTYPLTAQGFQNQMVVKPFARISAQLTGDIPLNAEKSGWKLSVSQSANVTITATDGSNSQATLDVPMELFNLQDLGTSAQATQKGFAYSTTAGTYTFSLNSVHRLPWQDQDELAADFNVTNNGKTTIPVPKLTGYYMLDGAVKVSASGVIMDNLLGIAPGKSVHLQLIGKIPYNDEFSGLQVYLQDNSGSAPAEISHFDASNLIKTVPDVAVDKTYTSGDIGHKADYSIADTVTYNGDTDKIFSATVQAQNGEKRLTDLTQLVGYFEAPDGSVFPATISDGGSKVAPGGKGLLTVWTALPLNYDTTGMKLLLGEALSGGKLAAASDTPDSYTQAFKLDMPTENMKVNQDFNKIGISPYTLSLSNIELPQIFNNNLNFSFDYSLERDLTVSRNMANHQYLMELRDSKGEIMLQRYLPVEGSTSSASSSSDSTTLQIGQHTVKLSIPFTSSYGNEYFTVDVYSVFNSNYKKLIASQNYSWYGNKPTP